MIRHSTVQRFGKGTTAITPCSPQSTLLQQLGSQEKGPLQLQIHLSLSHRCLQFLTFLPPCGVWFLPHPYIIHMHPHSTSWSQHRHQKKTHYMMRSTHIPTPTPTPTSPPPPQPLPPPPAMAERAAMTTKPKRPPRPPSGRTNLASCVVATIFLIFIVIVILIVYFTVFKPQDPKIAVSAVQLPSFSVVNGTVNFTFSQYASVRNPNRAVFSHYDSSLQLLYSGTQVGFMFIPAGEIDAGRTQYMAATFSVQSFPLSAPAASVWPTLANGDGVGFNNGFRVEPTMEIESKLEMAGRVRVLHFFTHRVQANAGCRVAIAVTDGSVLGFHC